MMNAFIVFAAINQHNASVPNLLEECILQCLNDTDDVNESNILIENVRLIESKSLASKRQSTPKLYHDDAKRLRKSTYEELFDARIANVQIPDTDHKEVSNEPCESLSNDLMQNESLQFSQQVKPQTNSKLLFNFTSFKDFRTNCTINNSFTTIQPTCSTADEIAKPSEMMSFDPENDLIDCIKALEIDLYDVNEDDDLIRHLRRSVYSNDKKTSNYCLAFTNTDNKKYVDKILDFLKNYQNDENVVYQQIQELYIFFIANKCLTYDFKLAVHKFNSNLWGIHRYCIEFYSYIIWTFEEIAANNARCKEHEEIYKIHLTQEMIYIDQIIDLYGQLIPAAGEVKENLQSQLFDVIKDMRNETMTYLNKFYPFENLAHFYTILCATSFGPRRQSVIQYAGKDVAAKPNASEHPISSALAVKDVKTNIRNHLHCSIANTAFLLAFTANFSYFKYANFVASIESDNNACYSNPRPTGLDIVLRQYRSIFQVAVVNTLKFVAATRIKDLLINTQISEIKLKIFFLDLVVEANKIFVSRSAHFILRHIQAIILQSMGYRSIENDQEINS